MIKIVTIIGARPQIIKAAAISRAIKKYFSNSIHETIVHTGQHYDANMSQVFFDEMQIPEPDYNLNVGSASHGEQTAVMLQKLESLLLDIKPDFLVVYGDTNSTLAGAIAASKIHVPIAHVEAGLRSFNKKMPEEINRIMCDHVSTLLFSPTETGYKNLINEGFNQNNKPPFTNDNSKIYHCGDVMYDNSMFFADIADNQSTILQDLELENNNYLLGTIHRDTNTDNPSRLNQLFEALNEIALKNKINIVLPLHPRTSKMLEKNLKPETYQSVSENELFKIIQPVSFLDMIMLEKNAGIISTDSGGVQKEAFFFKKPLIIMRDETEWKELVENGNAIITGADKNKIIHAFDHLMNKTDYTWPEFYGDGDAGKFICDEILKCVSDNK
jgi:UDP-GlcNAc3NAcA epimerase